MNASDFKPSHYSVARYGIHDSHIFLCQIILVPDMYPGRRSIGWHINLSKQAGMCTGRRQRRCRPFSFHDNRCTGCKVESCCSANEWDEIIWVYKFSAGPWLYIEGDNKCPRCGGSPVLYTRITIIILPMS